MPVDDLGDPWEAIRDLQDRMRRQERANPFESTSVTSGRVRFIGGLLRIDSGGRLEVVGTLQIDGSTIVTGTLKVEGPWEMTGNGTITGATSITGDVTVSGRLVQNGDWELNGSGAIRGTALVQAGGKLVVQGGGGDVVLDSSFGSPRIQLGGSQIEGSGSAITLTSGSATVYIMDNTIRIAAMATVFSSSVDLPPGSVYADSSGRLYRVI